MTDWGQYNIYICITTSDNSTWYIIYKLVIKDSLKFAIKERWPSYVLILDILQLKK